MKENKKKVIYLVLLIAVTITAVGVATFAYFSSSVSANANVPMNVAAANGSVFTASSEGGIDLDLGFEQMSQANVSTNIVATDNATVTVKLDSESENDAMVCTYDLVWVWDSVDKYTTSDVTLPYIEGDKTYPYELSSKIDEDEEKDLSSFTWNQVDSKYEAIVGSKEIRIDGKGSTTNTHQIIVSAYNIPVNQANLFNKEFKAHIEVKNNICKAEQMLKTMSAVGTDYIADADGNAHNITVNVTTPNTAVVYYSTTKELTQNNYTEGQTNLAVNKAGTTKVYWCAVANGYIPYCSSNKVVNKEKIATYIKIGYEEQGTSFAGTNGKLYLHDTNLAGSAQDNSYRYSGSNPNNYVCFEKGCSDDNKYRIIGVFGDQTKVIKHTKLSENMAWATSNSNTWQGSSLETYLNNETNGYLSTIKEYKGLIADTSWVVSGYPWSENTSASNTAKRTYDFEVAESCSYCGTGSTGKQTRIVISRKIGLMYVSEYMYSTENSYWTKPGYQGSGDDIRTGKTVNWLYDSANTQWTISRSSDDTYFAFSVDATGSVFDTGVTATFAVRPSFNLISSVKLIDGSGSLDDPYIVSL